MKHLTLIALVFVLISCSNDTIDPIVDSTDDTADETPTPTQSSPNVLLIIADDMGLDASPGYNLGSVKPNMPNLQNMINTGLRFNNLWSYPTCTPTRSSILTGKYGFRTNVTQVGDFLSTSEVSLQDHISNNTGNAYSTAVIGKWHVSTDPNHPTNMGIDYYSGLLNGGVQSYWNWNFTENAQTTTSTEYTTTKFTDLAIDWIDNQTKPWFLWLAYNAPHTPFHLPLNDLHSQGVLPTDDASIDANPLPYYMAMLEAMDSEMGRLLSSMTQEEKDNTVIIFIGDNGTPNQVVQEYSSYRAKGSVYQGGVNVPMIVSGLDVNRINDTEDALVHTADLFATISEITGAGSSSINDSQSFAPLLTDANAAKRDYVYTEIGKDTGGFDYTIRNGTHKYILFDDGSEALYNLVNNPLENPNLLNPSQLPLSDVDSAIKDELTTKVTEIRQ